MMIKIAPALLAVAALLPGTLATATCSLKTEASIIGVDVYSAADLLNAESDNSDFAQVILTEKRGRALHHITMRHYGADCRGLLTTKDQICNVDEAQPMKGNNCAQVTHKSHWYGFGTGPAVNLAADDLKPKANLVHQYARKSPSLQTWVAGVPGTCAHERFNAPDKHMKVLSFQATMPHQWKSIDVTLDEVDWAFASDWQCENAEDLEMNTPTFHSVDGIHWRITNLVTENLLKSVNEVPQN